MKKLGAQTQGSVAGLESFVADTKPDMPAPIGASPLPNRSNLPAHIFGLHDAGGEYLFHEAARTGWVTITVGLNPPDSSGDFSGLAGAGCGVVVRLNYGYDSAGTIPISSQVDSFAQMCADFVRHSQGANIWIIGNETNLKAEQPGIAGTTERQAITPDLYAQCFARCRAAIKALPGHANDWIVPAPPGPWNTETAYTGNPNGDWVQYFLDILQQCAKLGAPPDALALHTYTHGSGADLIGDESMMNDPRFNHRHFNFRAYRDFLAVVPPSFRTLPVFITETQAIPWPDANTGWIEAAYAEINAWNADAAHQPIQAMCLFRWQNAGSADWVLSTRSALVDELRETLKHDYRVRWPDASTVPPVILPKPLPINPGGDGWCPFAARRPINNANYAPGRGGQTIRAVVLHIAAGPLTAIFPTFNNPNSQTSAHFGIGKNGAIEQYLSINDTAYANGLRWTGSQWFTPTNRPVIPAWPDIIPTFNPNLYTVSIEHEGQPNEQWTPQMDSANTRLLQWISAQSGLVYVPHRTLIGHHEIDPVDRPNCPGPNVQYERIAADANGDVDKVAIAAFTVAQAQAGIGVNPDGALYKFARQNNLGWPLTGEFQFSAGADPYVGQVFEKKIGYVKVGDWGNIHTVEAPRNGPAPAGPVDAAAFAAATQLTWLSLQHDTPLCKFADQASFGPPQTAEWAFTSDNQGYVGQVFGGNIVYAMPGSADHVKSVQKVAVAALLAATQQIVMPVNANGALYKFAQQNNLGYPQTNEFEFAVANSTYVGQVFSAAIAYVLKGDWSHIKSGPKSDPLSPADPLAVAVLAAAKQLAWLPIHTDSALYQYAQRQGLGGPQTDEFTFVVDDATCVGQVYSQGIVYMKKGDQSSMRWLRKPKA